MTPTRPRLVLVPGVLLACGLLIKDAFGYIDPGTGSYVLQIAIAFLVGVAFSVKVFWKRIAAFLRRTFGGKRGGDPDVS